MQLFTRRSISGTILSLILVGELAVGPYNGLFTPVGLIVLLSLYFSFFHFMDSLYSRLAPSPIGMALITFAIYSVGITGLLHGEIADYVRHPQNNIITTLIRVQCSMFTIYVFWLINKYVPPKRPPLRIKNAGLLLLTDILILSLSGKFGLVVAIKTFQQAPILSIVFLLLGATSFWLGCRTKAKLPAHSYPALTALSLALAAVAAIPTIGAFITLLFVTIAGTLACMTSRRFRNMSFDSAYTR